jgi:hypothetical protein
LEEFNFLYDSTPAGGFVNYNLPYPKWQFLTYLCKSRNFVLHGSQNQEINEVQPQKAVDTKEFSARKAIYATTDGIWAIFFAIIDRMNCSPLSLFNSCIEIKISSDQVIGPLYFFSITYSALVQKPWCQGAIYILPRDHFGQEPAQQMAGAEIIFPHWISSIPARPLARLLVKPEDFPFLEKIHGHNDEKLSQLAMEDPGGFPWPESLVLSSGRKI